MKKRFGRTLAPSDTRGRATSPIPAIIFLITILLNEVEKQFRRLSYTISPIMSREKFLPGKNFSRPGLPHPVSTHRARACRRPDGSLGQAERTLGNRVRKNPPSPRARRSSGCAGIPGRDVECGSPLPSVSASDILSTRGPPPPGLRWVLGAAVLTRSDVQPPAGAGSHAVGGNLDVVGSPALARGSCRTLASAALCGCRLSVSQGLARARPRLRLIAAPVDFRRRG
jgi:hypothetical protein